MSDPASINDRLEAAAVKAEGASEIMRRMANDPVGAYIQTESGELPSLAEWYAWLEQQAGGLPELQASVGALEQASANMAGAVDALEQFDADLSDSADPVKGAGKIGFSGTTVASVLEYWITPKYHGAVGDGLSRPLSTKFSTLAEAQAVYPQAVALTDELDWAACSKAVATGRDVLIPPGTYLFNRPITMLNNGQAFCGRGMDTVTLKWVGSDNTLNFIEVASGRRDTGNAGTFRRGRRVGGFFITSSNTAVCKNLIWIENGAQDDYLEKIRVIMPGRPAEAVLKLESGGGASYAYSPTLRDIQIRGQLQMDNAGVPLESGVPIPVGVWLESCIEGFFENVEVYQTEVAWRFGTGTAAANRMVADCTFVKCHGEIGKGGTRANGTDAGVAYQFYHGVNLSFYGCKGVCGADLGAGAQRVMTFAASGSGYRSLSFRDQFIWSAAGAASTAAALEFLAGCDLEDVLFDHPTVDAPAGIISISPSADPKIGWKDPTYAASTHVRGSFSVRGVAFPAVTLADHEMASVSLTGFQLPLGEPFLVSCSGYLNGCLLSSYKNSGFNQGTATVLNETSASRSITSSRMRWREVAESEIRARVATSWDPGAITQYGSASVTLTVPGAQLGDFVVAGFGVGSSGGLRDMVLHARVSAPNTVTVSLTNFSAASSDFGASLLVVCLLNYKFDAFVQFSVDPINIASGNGVSTTHSVPGVSPGDFVLASLSSDPGGLIIQAQVSTTDTVVVRMHNETGAAIDPAPATLSIAAFKRHLRL